MNHFSLASEKSDFLKNVQNAREERANEKKRELSAIIIQAHVRGWLRRRHYRRTIVDEFDSVIRDDLIDPETGKPYLDGMSAHPALHVYHVVNKFFSVWKESEDVSRFLKLCRFISKSMEEDKLFRNYLGVFLLKEHSLRWISQLKRILYKCNVYLINDPLSTRSYVDQKKNRVFILLCTLVTLTSTEKWSILSCEKLQDLKHSFHNLCKNFVGFLVQQDFYDTLKAILVRNLMTGPKNITLTSTSIKAIMVLSGRPLLYSECSEVIVNKFVENILTVPALIYHASSSMSEFLYLFEKPTLLVCLMNFVRRYRRNCEMGIRDNDPTMARIMSLNKNNNLLCFVANFIEIASYHLRPCVPKNLTPRPLAYTSVGRVTASLIIMRTKKEHILNLIDTLTFLLLKCQECVSRTSNLTQWHPILGWFSQDSYDINLHECLPLIRGQLSMLWGRQFLHILLYEPLTKILDDLSSVGESSSDKKVIADDRKNSLKKKALDLFADVSLMNVVWKNKETKPNAEAPSIVKKRKMLGSSCKLYYILLNTFVELRLDLLTSLSYHEDMLHKLWKYLSQNSCVKSFYRYASSGGVYKDNSIEDNCRILSLFSECMNHYIIILDDVEMYDQQELFSIAELTQLSLFLNNFVYKGIMSELFSQPKARSESSLQNCIRQVNVFAGNDFENDEIEKLFVNAHTLLKTLYLRNCRRPYVTSKTHWIVKDFKMSSFFGDTDKYDRKILFLRSKIPHVIPYSDRVHVFKKVLFEEKCSLRQQIRQRVDGNIDINFAASNPSVSVRMIKIRRNNIVEDAFHYFHKLDNVDMKQAFRIKFVNAEGLEEAGIDQAGIFKEFIVELIRKLFDPSLNLFTKTSQGHFYPSTLSSVSDKNHVELIEFTGKMLAKAVYEGVVLDVRLASFFLSQILGQTQSNEYSYLDDMPSMDEELYRSLMYIKRYEGDVSDLALTFSTNEDTFGTVTTRELVPGGRVINVTDDNKIIYIHMMAHNKMHTQIKVQTAAFATGFHSLFTKDLLSLFSVPELQLLISGEDQPLDFTQLRLHTQYYGGFHDSHKVIVWLWDILMNDFNEQERALFLKFVTSSSRPPVLGFAFLNPPFAIRCVEVSEDEDYGDSVGSVIRGFFTIRRREPEHRLPTSSTCFNLLKLPNYSRKNVLKEKLRYAITANSGFELS